jgi:hypothetical protein
MTLEDFAAKLQALAPGRSARVAYRTFDKWFPAARLRLGFTKPALDFARSANCAVDDLPNERRVAFVKLD